MKTEQPIPDLTIDDLFIGLPEELKSKYAEVTVIMLSTLLEMNRKEAEQFITVICRMLSIQGRVIAKEETEAMMSNDRGWQ